MPTITLTFNNTDELDTELRGLLETLYQDTTLDSTACIEQFQQTTTEFNHALDAKVVGAFFNHETHRYTGYITDE